MTHEEVKRLQTDLNIFTNTHLKGLAPIRVDGDLGYATRKRIRTVKYHLGYLRPINDTVNHAFRMRLRYPKSRKYSTLARLALARKRRIASRLRFRRNKRKATRTTGVATFDGRPVAAWFVPYLTWARHNGWQGRLVSGWRDPVYSRHLCIVMCGRPSCPGRCAGMSSNHVGSTKPRGAVDVSDYARFGQLMRSCPHSPKLHNALGARDPVHFSASGG